MPKYGKKDYEEIVQLGFQGILGSTAEETKKVEYRDDTGQTYQDMIKIDKKRSERKKSKKKRLAAQKEVADLVSAPM